MQLHRTGGGPQWLANAIPFPFGLGIVVERYTDNIPLKVSASLYVRRFCNSVAPPFDETGAHMTAVRGRT
ncbi:hypothetical protein ACPOL_4026 [Acidisarcina polymorpha]|uniref:Uncharacterized protein n=1 Tax=Acidisarcina polymorpha TaxID=2211140 RepID=A0A2Z5G3U2_9BACT|nr:hypothetical protein ACPOL_4026 [Acidisarcina polymorpha]